MKTTATLSLALALFASSIAFAQSTSTKPTGVQDPASSDARATIHRAVAVVKATDIANGKVTLSHEPIQSLKWPAMTMAFAVKDKRLFDRLVVGKKVNVGFVKQESDYVVTSVN